MILLVEQDQVNIEDNFHSYFYSYEFIADCYRELNIQKMSKILFKYIKIPIKMFVIEEFFQHNKFKKIIELPEK